MPAEAEATNIYYEIEAQSTDWLYLLGKLVSDHKPETAEQCHTHLLPNGNALFHIAKDWMPAPDLARTLGTTPSKLLQSKRITLRPLAGSTGWQSPTVDYWGEA